MSDNEDNLGMIEQNNIFEYMRSRQLEEKDNKIMK